MLAAAAAYDEKDLDVVKVTVDRREQNIQKFGGSVSAFTEEDLQRIGITSIKNMASVNPALEIGVQEGNTEVFVRGIGGSDNTELGDPAVATYLNGVYIPRPRGVGSMFFDIERVELERGPQGTLRGRNATGGSLSLITARPKLGEFAASGDLQYGNYSQKVTRAMLNVPIGSKLALRLATFSENHDPFYHNGGPINTITPSENADSLAYRASLGWEPADRVKVSIIHDYTQENGTGYTGTNFAPALAAGLLPSEVPDPRAVIWRGAQPSQNMKHWGVATNVNVDLGPVSLELLGSYRSLRYKQVTGGNAGVAFPGMNPPDLDNWSVSYWNSSSKSWVAEARLYSPDTARFRWTAGGFFFYESQTDFLASPNDKGGGPGEYNFGGIEFNMPDVKSNSPAVYADGTFDFTSKLRGTLGGRFTKEHKHRTGFGAVYLFDTGGQPFRFGTEGFNFQQEGRTIYNPPMDHANGNVFYNGISTFGARDTLQKVLVKDNSNYTYEHGDYDQNFVDARAGLDYDLTPRNFLYGRVSTGHHSGGFNDTITLASGASISPTYKPETLYSLEVGSKNQSSDKKLTVNAAGFLYFYRNQQFQTVQSLVDPGDTTKVGAPTLVRFNAAKSHIYGLEVEGRYNLPFGLYARAAGVYLESVFDEGEITDSRQGYDPSSEPIVHVKGLRLPRSPKITVNYSVGQNVPTDFGYFDWLVSAQTRSMYFMTVFNGDGRDNMGNVNPNLSDSQPLYTRVDAGIGYTRPNGKVRFELVGNNLTNSTYLTSLINTPGLNLRFFNSPRQYGARLLVFY